MARAASRYVCQNCGAVHAKWAGRCETCGAWNSIVEEAAPTASSGAARTGPDRRITLVGMQGEAEPPPRRVLGLAELDRVLGGGLVPASAILVGGDPGIGKSTLLLQAAASLAQSGGRAIYISGEESVDQMRMRARRLGLGDAPVELAAATQVQRHRGYADGGRARCVRQARRAGRHRFDPDHVASTRSTRARHGRAGARLGARIDPPRQVPAASRWCWSAMSPRTAPWPGRA